MSKTGSQQELSLVGYYSCGINGGKMPKAQPKQKSKITKKEPLIKTSQTTEDTPASIELNEGDVALVIGEKESTLFLPAHLGDDDPVPEHMQLMCAMAILFKNDPTFRKYIKKRWNIILKELEDDLGYKKQKKLSTSHRKTLKRGKGAWIN